MKLSEEVIENPIKGEIYSVERLEEYAAFLAGSLKVSDNPKIVKSLLPRLRDNGKSLLASYRSLTEAIHRNDTMPPAAVWLTDNFHIVEDQLREIQVDFPPGFYKELPKITQGEVIGYPRVYAIALALIAHTDSQVEPDTIRRFVHSFQKISPLSIGELWALAITLKIALIENLRRTGVLIVLDYEKRNLANQFVDHLVSVVADKERFQAHVETLPFSCYKTMRDGCAFMAQVAKRLRDQEPELLPALEYLQKYLAQENSTTELVIDLSHKLQASHQITVANIITSMRVISELNWRDFFESLCLVDRALEKDPVYGQMDFLTRDRYRHVIEKMGKRTGDSEIEIAKKAVRLAKESKATNPSDIKESHVGYYLIGGGEKKLHKEFDLKKSTKISDFAFSHPNFIYFGLMIFILATTCAIPLYYSANHGATLGLVVTIGFLILIPCSDLAISILNLILTHAIGPKCLPKMDLSNGIPKGARTIVVIPSMLSGIQVIPELLEKLEIHYLGNKDNQLYFALLTDFTDAAEQTLPEDEANLKAALDGISKLNQKYTCKSGDRFFLFHRRRQWNQSEKVWMGWERKRGKIHEFNSLLREQQNTSFAIVTAPPTLLPTIRYVITLDVDTQLPRDSARKLVGTILHPLNQPLFDKTLGRVTEGYGILQPRIGISLESSTRSFFAKIFSGYTGIDPYTTAVSEVYQDLFNEGSYTGKGLYDIDAFEAALANRVPENTILSHDLFEGLYARAGLLTDIEFLDDYPNSYQAYFKRQHRWTRGDWQISAWIFPFVLNSNKQWVQNRLPLISRWKIFDNLRRSLVAPFTFFWFLLAWTVFPGSSLFWIGYAFSIVIFPSLTQVKKIHVIQALLSLTFLAHQAYNQLDAIVRVNYRKLLSKTKLLEWTTAAQVEGQKTKSTQTFWQSSWPTEFLLFGISILLLVFGPAEEGLALFFVLLWMSYPFVAFLISRKLIRKKKSLSLDGKLVMRQIARRIWHYFETFVGPEDNWLPPDNHQELPQPLSAHRTSPSNIGLYLLSLASARDFGFVSTPKFTSLLGSTLATMQNMEQYEGHYFNWYDTKTLQALSPKYVSTVDSGNLAGYFLAIRQACLEISNCFAIDFKIIDGLHDTISIIDIEVRKIGGNNGRLLTDLDNIQQVISQALVTDFTSWALLLKNLHLSFETAKNNILILKSNQPEKDYEGIIELTDSIIELLCTVKSEVALFAPWVMDEYCDLDSRLSINKLFDRNISLSGLSEIYDGLIEQAQEIHLTTFVEALKKGKASVVRLLSDADEAAVFINQKFQKMNFNFLLNKERGVFSIGYNVSNGKFDSGFYDLLGSESRLASFVGIAKGDIPQEHWFLLGRQLVPTPSGRALISWSASMFEYLMPLLVLRDYEDTLLSETIHTVVSRQIRYGHEQRVPWGVSEAGYNARDLQLSYQYGPFGIPGLGLKGGLGHDLVISPYSTLLASMVNPVAAFKNIEQLIRNKLLTVYGFYESIDYTTERLAENEKSSIIKSFMAHHQGMSLVAINNVINRNIIQDRFHNDPRVKATHLLLQERVPQGVTAVLPKAAEIEMKDEHQHATNSFIRHHTDPNSSAPRLQLLSNRNYSMMISTAGGGYSKCGDLAVTRWKEDATRDNWGSFIFIRDRIQGTIWSTTYQPFAKLPPAYKVTFGEDKVEFRRRDGDISTYTQILVAPEDNIEIRHVTLTNHSDKPRILELTSYLEPVLAPLASDLDHPAFSKLFIQTEFLASKNALLAMRRKRSPQDQESWGLHVVVTDSKIPLDIQYETDRSQFIGRGRSLINAFALSDGENLSNTTGSTLDPIMSLRVKVQIPAKGKTEVAFSIGLAASRNEALELADRYHDIHSFERESKFAWIKSQVDMTHFNIDSETVYLYQRLAERILYWEPSLRSPTHQGAPHTNVQTCLWPNGISGDLPIVVVRISNQKDITFVKKLLRCHEYLRLKGLVYDFVILNDHETTYFQDLQDELLQLVRTTGSQEWLGKGGGVFILRSDITPEKDIIHIQSVAHVSLSADQSLNEQISRKDIEEKYPEPLSFTGDLKEDPLPIEPKLDLNFFNGFGGFSQNGREYVTVLSSGRWTPTPWINVVGNNSGFGFQVSEAGSGFTWSTNSQTNRLTPWSNDPISDPSGEILYLRDDVTGEIWTPTPLPIRSAGDYTIKHGQGYTTFEHSNHGLQHTLTLFVPKNDLIKISLLRLKNLTNRKRKISVTSYTEWVLGAQREKTFSCLISDVDKATGAIFARNPHDIEFAARVAFADINSADRIFTCSRKEFLGRNGNYASPAALKRDGLSQKGKTGRDPCAVLQTSIELEPGEVREISILLGQTESIESARELVLRYRNLEVVKTALNDVINYWNSLTNSIQIKTQEPTMNMLMNSWLLYQTLSCRYWSRTAFYQSGGAFGFRDQLQDCMAFVYSAPGLTREHLLKASAHQFKEGDVQHWWHPPTVRGIRTRMTDDLLWLPFVVSYYIKITKDKTILTEKVPFLEAPLLKPEELDSYTLPSISTESETVFEHCIRAINRSLSLGQHNLPLMGTGDWNDGMNRVGYLGKGESIWLGWFLYKVLADFLPFCDQPEQSLMREKYSSHMKKLKEALEKDGWDGNWYKRAYFDDGTPLGSASNEECKIDSIAQSWAVLSDAGDAVRAKQAMGNVDGLLVQKKSHIILLLSPPFDKSPKDPGYIKGYVSGVRENGGQYTHAAVWAMMAYAELGDGNKAFELFNMLNPIQHSRTELESTKYKVEPYVLAGDVYAGGPQEGRGGWSWYTGSASWYYRACLESILGFRLQGDKLKLAPCIPSTWNGYEISYVYGKSKYFIKVENPKNLSVGNILIELDGSKLQIPEVNLVDDGKDHKIVATILQINQSEKNTLHFYNDQLEL